MERENQKDKKAGLMALWGRADDLARQGRATDAEELYQRVAEETDDSRLWIRVGRCRQTQGEMEKAKDVFEDVLAKSPSDHPAALFAGLADLDAGRLAEARERFGQVLRGADDNPIARCLDAVALYRAGEKREGIEQWERHFCGSPEFLGRLALTLEKDRLDHSRPSCSESDIAAAHEKDLAGMDGKRELTRQCEGALEEKNWALALAAARKLNRRFPRSAENHFALGFTSLEAGYPEQGQRAIGTGMRLERRQRLRGLLGRRRPTRRRLREALGKVETNPGARVVQAIALIRAGRPESARPLLESVNVEGPESWNKFYYLAVCALAEGEERSALEYFHYAFTRYGVDAIELCLRDVIAWAKRQWAA